jgi:hypothetical protein
LMEGRRMWKARHAKSKSVIPKLLYDRIGINRASEWAMDIYTTNISIKILVGLRLPRSKYT